MSQQAETPQINECNVMLHTKPLFQITVAL